ncbi:hypothetical protein ACIQRS_12505 [Streptomyces termitum]|nr:hypothetical protein [Streptomyces termitum]
MMWRGADAEGECTGKAYARALQHVIDHCGSDLMDLGVHSRPDLLLDRRPNGTAAERAYS